MIARRISNTCPTAAARPFAIQQWYVVAVVALVWMHCGGEYSSVTAFQLQHSWTSPTSSFHSITTKIRTSHPSHHPLVLPVLRLPYPQMQPQLQPLAMSTVPDENDRGDERTSTTKRMLVGDDAAYFDLSQQTFDQWWKFTIATTTVLLSLSYIWFLPFGLHGGDVLLHTIQSNSLYSTTDTTITMTLLLLLFAVIHSGMAGLRTYMEPMVGPRPWRVFFAVVSLPLALSCISYFINHAHDGYQLWDIRNNELYQPYLHVVLYITNFISFLFLYPSTFNLLEIAAVDEPQLHLYETGIIRITRHPQAFGQILWCVAHSIYLGTSTAIAASAILIVHHVFSIYHGDRRLVSRHGIEKFTYIQQQTSVIPFAAILDGRQQLPSDYYKEFLRLPYAVVIVGTMIAYLAHPYMQAGAALLHW
jgi:zeta-carotene isomerase